MKTEKFMENMADRRFRECEETLRQGVQHSGGAAAGGVAEGSGQLAALAAGSASIDGAMNGNGSLGSGAPAWAYPETPESLPSLLRD